MARNAKWDSVVSKWGKEKQMVYVLMVAVVGLAVLYWTAPKVYAAHAATAKPLQVEGMRPSGRYMFSGMLRDESGNRINTADKLLVMAVGPSMVDHGIKHGTIVLADVLDDSARSTLEPGDVVVVDAEAKASETGKRLRRIREIDDGNVVFVRNRDRPLSEIQAKVTHVVG